MPRHRPTRTATLAFVGVALLGAACTGAPPSGTPSPTILPTAAAGSGPTDRSAGSGAAASSGPGPGPGSTAGTATTAPSAAPSATPSRTGPQGDWRTGARVEGVDVSAYQPSVDWAGLARAGLQFVWIKASEGTTWRSPSYARQRDGAVAAGLLHGAYHYARPASSTGEAQARHFVAAGGGWRPDGSTLPGAVDLEAAERGDPCHGRTPAQLSAWLREFSETYRQLTTRVPVIYVRADLWARCLAGDRSFGANPLWLYDHDGDVGPWPAGWARPTVWQRGVVPVAGQPLDRNVWFGTSQQLRDFAARG